MTFLRLSLCCLLTATVPLIFTGCSSESQPQAGSTPRTESTASTRNLPDGWQFITGLDIPKVPASQQDLPATVVSDDGAEVTVTDSSRTIVGNDDIILVMEALGLAGQVFAAPTSSRTEVGRNAPHHFLFNRTTGIEGILSLDGTLFVGNSLRRHGKLAAPLRNAGQAMVIVDELQAVPDKVRKTAAIFGHVDEGELLATKIQSQLDQAAAIAAKNSRKPRIIHVSATGGGGTPTVAGADTAAAELIRIAGGINIGDESNVQNYSQLSNEGIVATEPEVILVTEEDLQEFGGEQGLWKAYPSLKLTPAGTENRVWIMPDTQLKVSSVASGAGALALAEAIHALVTNP